MRLFLLLLLFFLNSCATLPKHPPQGELLAYVVEEGNLLNTHAPVFITEAPKSPYNRIASPSIHTDNNGEEHLSMQVDTPVIFAEKRHWNSKKGSYTNLVYRIHFKEIPLSILPFYLGAGSNVGLLFIVTLDKQNKPLLYTTVNTCGCYLSFTSTSFTPKEMLPTGWKQNYQYVYSEYLPAYLDYRGRDTQNIKVNVLLRKATHRVKDFWLASDKESLLSPHVTAKLLPLEYLKALPLPNGESRSFFETEGSRKFYVKNSQKIWERLLISWWALDWRVGEDKIYGRNKSDGITFYTSLKPWAREESDMRNFATFLEYWGWNF